MTGSELKRRNWDNLSLEHNLCFQLPAVGNFPAKEVEKKLAKKSKMAPGKEEPRSGSKNIAASGIFGRETALRAFYKLMGGRRMDINDKRSVSTRTFLHSQAGQECRIWV